VVNFWEFLMSRRIQRRRFLQATAAAGFFVNPLFAGDQPPRAGERIRVGIIGVAGKGGDNLNQVEKSGPSPRMAASDSHQRRDNVQLRLQRGARGDGAARECRLSRRRQADI
jgi:hypothetical protein